MNPTLTDQLAIRLKDKRFSLILMRWNGRRKAAMDIQAYYVQDNKTGSIIYMGREHEPSQEFLCHDEAVEFLRTMDSQFKLYDK